MKYRQKLILLDVKTFAFTLVAPLLRHVLLDNAELQTEEKKAVEFKLQEN